AEGSESHQGAVSAMPLRSARARPVCWNTKPAGGTYTSTIRLDGLPPERVKAAASVRSAGVLRLGDPHGHRVAVRNQCRDLVKPEGHLSEGQNIAHPDALIRSNGENAPILLAGLDLLQQRLLGRNNRRSILLRPEVSLFNRPVDHIGRAERLSGPHWK